MAEHPAQPPTTLTFPLGAGRSVTVPAAGPAIVEVTAATDHAYHAPHGFYPRTCAICAELPRQGRP